MENGGSNQMIRYSNHANRETVIRKVNTSLWWSKNVLLISPIFGFGTTITSAIAGAFISAHWVTKLITFFGRTVGQGAVVITHGLKTLGEFILGKATMVGGLTAAGLLTGTGTILLGVSAYATQKLIYKLILRHLLHILIKLESQLHQCDDVDTELYNCREMIDTISSMVVSKHVLEYHQSNRVTV